MTKIEATGEIISSNTTKHAWLIDNELNPLLKMNYKTGFEAGHRLEDHFGKCSNWHGHNYKLDMEIFAEKLNEINIIVDAFDIEQALEKVDHKTLNTVMEEKNVSVEFIAEYLFGYLNEYIREHSSNNPIITSLTVYENDKTSATYGIFI